MRRPRLAAVIAGIATVATGCGRVHFDDRVDSGAARDGAQLDAGIGAGRTYIKASNPGTGDAFGAAVALSADGTTLVVGAYGEDSAAAEIDGNQADDSAPDSGAAYVFVRGADGWSQQAYLKASNSAAGDQFGVTVTVSGDGNTIAIGALNEDSKTIGIDGDQTSNAAIDSGAVYLFHRTGSVWAQTNYVKAGNTGAQDHFGQSVALSADGHRLAVGADGEASAGTGTSANPLDNTAPLAGAVYVFRQNGSAWSQEAYLKASNTDAGDYFGEAIALSGDGATLAVGAFVEASAAQVIDGNQSDNSASGAGAVYIFHDAGTGWLQQAYIKAANAEQSDELGFAVALSADGNLLTASAYLEDSAATGIDGDGSNDAAIDSGAAYQFARAGSTWSQHAYIKAFDTAAGDGFGHRVAMSADGATLAVGAIFEASNAQGIGGDASDGSAPQAGAVYLLARDPVLRHDRYIKATNTGAGDRFSTVALSADGGTLAVGAAGEDSAAAGIDGDQSDDSAPDSGAVYIVE